MQGQLTQPHHRMDEPCNMCGNVGSKDALATCSKCHIAREHVYCMRVLMMVVPQDWVCEECLSRDDKVSPKLVQGDSRDIAHAAAPSKAFVDSQGLFHYKKLKPYETGKVKYLPVAEAFRLSSGVQGKGSYEGNNSRIAMPSKNVIPNFSIPRVKANSSLKLPDTEVLRLSSGAQRKNSHENNNFRTAMPSKNVIPKSSIQRMKANTGFKLPSHGGAQIIRKNDHQTARTSKKSIDTYGAKEVKISEPRSKEVETQNANADYTRNEASYGSSTLRCSIPISTGQSLRAVAGENSSFEERDLLDILPKLQLYCQYLPSLKATWNGKFLFPDSTLDECNGCFQAHPPCKSHRKAFEFSQKLPRDLQVKLLPRCPYWKDLFGDGSPDFHDIALYIFPADNTERFKHNYSCLFEFLETKNLVMRSYIDGVELLISTSKQLHVDSQKIIARSSTQYFLWGVFRRAKSDLILHEVHEDFPSLVSPMECACDGLASMDNDQAVDVDIDMEVGRSVGTVDMVLTKELSGRPHGSPEKGNPGSATHQLESSEGPASMDNVQVVDMDIDMEGGRSVGTVDMVVTKELSGRPCGSPEKGNPGSATHQLESSDGKMANGEDEVCLPPGFETVSNLNSGIMEEEIGLGACSPQPQTQRSPKAFDLTRSKKTHQEPASDPGHDPLTAYPRRLSEKDRKNELNIKAEGSIHENQSRKRDTKELKIKPFFDEHYDSCSAEEYAGDKNTEHKTDISIF